MKKIFIAGLLFVLVAACAKKDDGDSDGDGQNSVRHISEYKHTTFNEFPQPNSYEAYFNEIGKYIRINSDHFDNVLPGYELFEYTVFDKIETIKFYLSDGTYSSNFEYEYDASNKLTKLTDNAAQSLPLNTVFTYNGNEVTTLQLESGKTGSFTFNSDNRLIETSHDSGPSDVTRQEISYDSQGKVVEIRSYFNNVANGMITFEYDDKINPFYEAFMDDPLSYFTREIFDVDFSGYSNFFSPANVTKITRSGNPPSIDSRTIQYNDDDYPTSATTMRNGELRSMETFVYY